ncbi:MAG: 2-oxoacid:ferredoxin oxidoreductase subunit gamma [Chloroflexota bacterium]|nr:MAG: 2-oxoacid:ferredoxin oxidoreductase subunit gamma [Chloroflexota bacterium]
MQDSRRSKIILGRIPMQMDILLAGFGGQGIKLMSHLLGAAATAENHSATMYADYKDEIRGGAIQCMVRVGEGEILSPITQRFDVLIAMNEDAVRVYEPAVNRGGLIIYNSSLVGNGPARSDVESLGVPANALAEELGSVQVASMIALGAFAEKTKLVGTASVVSALSELLPPHRQKLLPFNQRALDRGSDFVKNPQ